MVTACDCWAAVGSLALKMKLIVSGVEVSASRAVIAAPLDWTRYPDRSAEELAALIQAKIAQQPLAAPTEEPVVLNLLDALKQSVAASQAEKGAQRSAAAQARKPRARRKS